MKNTEPFKVGDRVRLKSDEGSGPDYPAGTIHSISETEVARVKFDPDSDGDETELFVTLEEMVHIDIVEKIGELGL